MRRPLVVLAFAVVLAGCGGGQTVQPLPETVSGEVPQEAAPTTTLAQEGNAEAGRAIYEEQGCGSCHTYEQAGTTGTIGPNLNEALQGKDAAFVLQSIVDPNAQVASGFQPGVMPQDYAQKLDDQQLADLVAFLLPQS